MAGWHLTLASRSAPGSHRLRRFGLDFALVVGVILVYFLARGAAPEAIGPAVTRARHVVALEERLGVFVEPRIQAASIQWHWLQETANFTYAYLHFPVLAVVGGWLWWRGRERFLFMRNVMFVSMAIGLVFYYALPTAPPRLLAAHGLDLGFVDTVFGGNTAVRYDQPALINNDYAAIPSFHFGWIALAAVAVWGNTRRRLPRGLSLLLVAVMSWAIVASANHFLLDMALGGVVIAASWWIAAWLTRPALRRTAPLPARVRGGGADLSPAA